MLFTHEPLALSTLSFNEKAGLFAFEGKRVFNEGGPKENNPAEAPQTTPNPAPTEGNHAEVKPAADAKQEHLNKLTATDADFKNNNSRTAHETRIGEAETALNASNNPELAAKFKALKENAKKADGTVETHKKILDELKTLVAQAEAAKTKPAAMVVEAPVITTTAPSAAEAPKTTLPTSAEKDLTIAQENVRKAQTAVDAAEQKLKTAQETLGKAKEDPAKATAQVAVDTAEENLTTARGVLTQAKEKLATATKTLNTSKRQEAGTIHDLFLEKDKDGKITGHKQAELITMLNGLIPEKAEAVAELFKDKNTFKNPNQKEVLQQMVSIIKDSSKYPWVTPEMLKDLPALKRQVEALVTNEKQAEFEEKTIKDIETKHPLISELLGGGQNLMNLINSHPIVKFIAQMFFHIPSGKEKAPKDDFLKKNGTDLSKKYGDDFKKETWDAAKNPSRVTLPKEVTVQNKQGIETFKDERRRGSEQLLVDVAHRWDTGRVTSVESFKPESDESKGEMTLKVGNPEDAAAITHFYGSTGTSKGLSLSSFTSFKGIKDAFSLYTQEKEKDPKKPSSKEAKEGAKEGLQQIATETQKDEEQAQTQPTSSTDFTKAKSALPKNISARVEDSTTVVLTWTQKSPLSPFGKK